MQGKSPRVCEPGSQRPDHLKAPTQSHSSGRNACCVAVGSFFKANKIFAAASTHFTWKNTYFTASRDHQLGKKRINLTAAKLLVLKNAAGSGP